MEGHELTNLEAELIGSGGAEGTIGTVAGTVGANDNASGVAAALELAGLLNENRPRRAIRFVFFGNEEPPYFQTQRTGSLVYAQRLRQSGTRVSAMISLETIGYCSDAAGSQKYPAWLSLFYPSLGNFIWFRQKFRIARSCAAIDPKLPRVRPFPV